MSFNVAKWTFFLSLCASRIASFLLLTFSTCHAGIVSSFFLFPVQCCFRIKNVHHSRHRNKFVYQIIMTQSNCILCLRCDLRDFPVEMVPHNASWIHELPQCTRAWSWNLVGFATLRISFLEAGGLTCSFFYKALPPSLELPTFFACLRCLCNHHLPD